MVPDSWTPFTSCLGIYKHIFTPRKTDFMGQVWWYIPAVPALRKLRQEDGEFKAILGCKEKLSPKSIFEELGAWLMW
jgi:hypothetical protein